MQKLWSAILMVTMLLFSANAIAQVVEAQTDELTPIALNAQGFLDEGEYVVEDEENGYWYYVNTSLRIEINRMYDEENNLTWTEAEIFSNGGDVFRMIPNNENGYEEKKWISSQNWPAAIAKNNGVVFGVNSDYAHLRMSNKATAGVIIRNKLVFSEKTKRKNASGFPNLDTLALFPDGDMKVFYSNEHTADEYLQMGAVDVLAFGPVLIRDGELNEAGLNKYGKSKAPRTAIGMVEKGHYFAMMLEGRHSKSKGAGISFLAEKLHEKGCTVAMNLDGGQTATMVFMGKQIITIGKTSATNASARKTAEILGIGYSQTVVEIDDKD